MSSTPQLPSPVELGQALATPNDWRAIMIVQAFIIISLMGFIGWREFSIVSLRKSIDRVSEALWLLRLTLIEKGAKERNEHDELR